MLQNKKAIILYILKILEKYSDANHPLTQVKISDLIRQEYCVDVERKTIGYYLQVLLDFDYDIRKVEKKGFYLGERIFDPSEVTFLTDAIYSSKIIESHQAKQLSEKIYSTLSKYDQRHYDSLYKTSDISRANNKEFFCNIEVINEAIAKKKKVKFQYINFDEKGNEVFRNGGFAPRVSPYFLVNNYGRYYLVANYYKSNGTTNYRIDLMKNVVICENENARDFRELTDLPKNFSISDYVNDHIYMFGGKVITSEIEIDDVKHIVYIKDWFGNRAKFYKVNDKLYARVKVDEDALVYWALQYIQYFKIVKPIELQEKIKELLKNGLDKYENKNT